MKCRKRGYRDELSAKIALASTQGRKSARRNEVRFYRCNRCGRFHLTSSRKGS